MRVRSEPLQCLKCLRCEEREQVPLVRGDLNPRQDEEIRVASGG